MKKLILGLIVLLPVMGMSQKTSKLLYGKGSSEIADAALEKALKAQQDFVAGTWTEDIHVPVVDTIVEVKVIDRPWVFDYYTDRDISSEKAFSKNSYTQQYFPSQPQGYSGQVQTNTDTWLDMLQKAGEVSRYASDSQPQTINVNVQHSYPSSYETQRFVQDVYRAQSLYR